MVEIDSTVERIGQTIKRACIENYTKRGYTDSDDEVAASILSDRRIVWHANTCPRNETAEQSANGFTLVTQVPMLASNFWGDRIPLGLSPQDSAIFMSYKGKNSDSHGRDGIMRNVVVMSSSNASGFIEDLRKDPTLVYALLRKLNGGPIQREDGTPMTVAPGKAIEFNANNELGGNLKANFFSAPFPPGYNPNP